MCLHVFDWPTWHLASLVLRLDQVFQKVLCDTDSDCSSLAPFDWMRGLDIFTHCSIIPCAEGNHEHAQLHRVRPTSCESTSSPNTLFLSLPILLSSLLKRKGHLPGTYVTSCTCKPCDIYVRWNWGLRHLLSKASLWSTVAWILPHLYIALVQLPFMDSHESKLVC